LRFPITALYKPDMSPKQPSNARSLALRALREVDQGAFASESIDGTLKKHWLPDAERSLFTQLVYGVLRERGFLDLVLSRYISKAKTPPALIDLLRLAAYQCLSLDKVPDYAAVNEAVELAKAKYGPGASRLANAVLRSLLREKEEVIDKLSGARRSSYPDWMLRRWRRRYSEAQIESLFDYFSAPAPVWARVNLTKASTEDFIREAALSTETPSPEPMLDLTPCERSQWLEWMNAGSISIQDRHSYQVAAALKPMKGEKILDACAGHGGKSSALAEAAPEIDLYVHDPSEERIRALAGNFARLGLRPPRFLKNLDAAVAQSLIFDAILIDAPCSGMGTLGRKPEIRWRLKPADLGRMGLGQRAILKQWTPFLKAGGRAVYAVCSLEPEEGKETIAAFLAEHSDFALEDERELVPEPGAGDGFYLAILRKNTSGPSLASGK
jgi:16S rRNA (cytosine967-C5)-methyltransferase